MINDTANVPERLCAAAARLFADRGYEAVTTREIATAAGVTLACINYHFDGKEGLYRDALLRTHRQVTASLQVDGVDAEADVRRFIGGFIHALLAADQVGLRLMCRELIQPTAALDEVVERSIRPIAEKVQAAIATLLGETGRDRQLVQHIYFGVVGQCLQWYTGRAVIERLHPDAIDADAVAQHLADFTIGGIRALAARPSRSPGP